MMLAASPDQTAESEKSLRDQVITIFLAGYETVANALSWTWYLLSQNPECERRFHEEIDRELQGRVPAFDDVPRLRYVEMVMAESMRLYPPAWAMGRYARNDFQLGRIFSARQNHGADQPVHHPSRCAFLSRSAALRSGALYAGEPKRAARSSPTFRLAQDFANALANRLPGWKASLLLATIGAEVETETGSGTSRRAGAAHHAAPEIRHANDGGSAAASQSDCCLTRVLFACEIHFGDMLRDLSRIARRPDSSARPRSAGRLRSDRSPFRIPAMIRRDECSDGRFVSSMNQPKP